jgi:hypothetical protein
VIPSGASGQAAALPFSLIVTSTGLGTAGHTFVDAGGGLTAHLKVQCPSGTPGTYVNATISRIVEIGGGNYEYQMSAGESADPGVVYYYVNVALHDGDSLVPKWDRIVDVPTTTAITTALLEDAVVLGSYTLGDLIRLFTAVLAGPVLDFTTGTLIFKCPVTNTTRLTVTTNSTGRLVCVIGTLT